MPGQDAPVQDAAAPARVAQRLLRALHAQVAALDTADLEAFQQAADERDTLTAALDADVLAYLAEHGDLLGELVELDRRALGLARRRLDETGQELRQLRQGRAAVHGYNQTTSYTRPPAPFRRPIPSLSGIRPLR